jgi:hypothetical protein
MDVRNVDTEEGVRGPRWPSREGKVHVDDEHGEQAPEEVVPTNGSCQSLGNKATREKRLTQAHGSRGRCREAR